MTPLTLAEWLDACAADTGLRMGVATAATRYFAAALAANETMRNEARVLIETGRPVEQRDHLTRWRNSLLRQALGATDERDTPG